ncbi:MAG: sulfatase-like hydrolase/transferase [Planctomycetota bacterium]
MKRPNILLLFTDMQRGDTIGALGNPHMRTPNLDRLVREGTAFTRCFTPSPVCVPARYSMHYGSYPMHTDIVNNSDADRFPDDGSSYVSRLAKAGYRTHGIGKMHFTPNAAGKGFQSREIQEELFDDPSEDDYLKHLHASGYKHVLDHHGVRSDWYYLPQMAQMPAELHPTQWIGDRSVKFIEQASDKKPWYLTASFVHPHPPFALPSPWNRLYDSTDMPDPGVPADCDAHLTMVNRIQNRYKYRDQGIDRQLLRQIRAAYYGCISFVDYQIGRILQALERRGELDNTLILFSSDHGELLGEYHCFGKRSMHDASARVPMIARLPGTFAAGAVCRAPTSLVDVAPTVCTLGQTAKATAYDGLPLHEVAAGKHQREAVFSQYQRGDKGEYLIATSDWSLFWSASDQREYVYHTAVDPQQQRLVSEAWHPREVAHLRAGLQQSLYRGGQRDAVVKAKGKLTWKSYSQPRNALINPSAGLLVQRQLWALAQSIIPGYTTPAQIANQVRPEQVAAFVRRYPKAACFAGLTASPVKKRSR